MPEAVSVHGLADLGELSMFCEIEMPSDNLAIACVAAEHQRPNEKGQEIENAQTDKELEASIMKIGHGSSSGCTA
jgi:hypothetical protein